MSRPTAQVEGNDRPTAVPGLVMSSYQHRLARVLWLAVAVLSISLFIASLPTHYQQIITFSNLPANITPAELQTNLLASGISPALYAAYSTSAELLFAFVCVTLAAVIFTRRSSERAAWLVSLTLVLLGTTFWGSMQSLGRTSPEWSGAIDALDRFATALLILMLYVYPNGRFVPHWTRWLALMLLALTSFVVLFPQSVLNPERFSLPVFLVVLLALLFTGLGAQMYRYRFVSNQLQRQQTKWVVFGVAAAFFGFSGTLFLAEVVLGVRPGTPGELTGFTFITLSMLLIPLSVALSVLRYRLWDIDLVINRALVYGALSLFVIGGYTLTVVSLASLFHSPDNLLLSIIASGLVAVLFAPLKNGLQRRVNRLLYGERDEPYRAVSKLGERLAASIASDAVLPSITSTVREALRVPYAAVALPVDGAFRVVSAAGEPPREELHELHVLPLTYGREIAGKLLITPRAPGEQFSRADRELLNNLARHAGVAVHGVNVVAELRRSREQLVLAREEERRWLRRDLHDNLGPTLAGLSLTAATAGELITTNPDGARGVMEELRQAIRTAASNVRQMAYDLRPPALDEFGLVEAIKEQAERVAAQHGILVQVEASCDMPGLPAAVEVAAFRVAQEAITNVVRHAGARVCRVRLERQEGTALLVEVEDDGRGFPADKPRGVGLSSMVERAEELGGHLRITPVTPSGTRVQVVLPLSRAQHGMEVN